MLLSSTFLQEDKMATRRHPKDVELVNFPQQNDETKEELNLKNSFCCLNDDEILEIQENKEKMRQFCCKLLEWYNCHGRKAEELRHLKRVIGQIWGNSAHLQGLIENAKVKRQGLVESLRAKANKMTIITKLCSATKLASSVIDGVGVIANVMINRTQELYTDMALTATNSIWYLGLVATAIENYYWKSAVNDLMKEIQLDNDYFRPILELFSQNNELKEAINAIFPFHLTPCIVKEFDEIIRKELDSLDALQSVIGAVLRHDQQQLNNVRLIENLIAFTTSPVARDLLRWICLQHTSVTLDLVNVLFHLNNHQITDTSQKSAMLITASSSSPIAVCVRLGLNCMNMLYAFESLKRGGLAEELKKLGRRFQQEMNTLAYIAEEITPLSKPN